MWALPEGGLEGLQVWRSLSELRPAPAQVWGSSLSVEVTSLLLAYACPGPLGLNTLGGEQEAGQIRVCLGRVWRFCGIRLTDDS